MAKARFIAGAVCPECQALDRLVIEKQSGNDLRRCVECGFTDALVSNHEASVPRGKPEKRASCDTKPQVIEIFDPKVTDK